MALAGRDAQGFAIPGLGEGGELLGRQRVEGDLLVPGLGVGADHDLPVRDLGQDTGAEPERLLNQPPGTGGREGWPRSMAGTARSQKMPFTIGAACRSMPLATATLVRGPDGGPGMRERRTAGDRSAPMPCGPMVDRHLPLVGAAALRVADLAEAR